MPRVTYEHLSPKAKKEAVQSALWGLEQAYRANEAYDAIARGDTEVATDGSGKMSDPAEIFPVLRDGAGANIGEGNLGALALEFYSEHRYYPAEWPNP